MKIPLTARSPRPGHRSSRAAVAIALSTAAGIGGGLVAAAPAHAAVFTVPSSIDRTGTTNVTTKLLAFFATVPDGSTIQFPAGAKYRSDGVLRLDNRNRLTFMGNGATIFATPGTGDRNRRHWHFVGGSGIVFRNLTVKGANPHAGTGDAAYNSTKEAQHGFDFGGVHGVELDRVTVTDVYGDFVYLGKKVVTGGAWSSFVWIHDSTFERNGRQGIAITGARDVAIERNRISQTRRATFDIEPNGADWGASQVAIRNNDVGPGRLLFVTAAGSGPVDDITISGNRLTGRAMNSSFSPPSGTRRSNVRFTDNVSDVGFGNSGGAAIYVYRTTGVTVSGNVQRLQAGRGMTGVEVREGCTVAVSGNTFVNSLTESRIISPVACP